MDTNEISVTSPDGDQPSSDAAAALTPTVPSGQTQVSGNVRIVFGFMGGFLVFFSGLMTQSFISEQGLHGFMADQGPTMTIVGAIGLLCCWLCWKTRRPVSNILANTLWIAFAIVMIFGLLAKATKFWLWG